jgi:hypothetical protein
MSIQFTCQCGKTLKAAEEYAGKRAKCNQCGQVVTIPGVRQEAANAAPMATPPVASAPKKNTPAAAAKVAIAELPKSDLDDFLFAELPSAQPMGLVAKPQTANAPAAAPVQSGGRRCPGCQSALSAAAMICVYCGYNLNTGKKMNTFTYAPSTEAEASTKKRRRSRINQILVSRLTSWKMWSGLGMMLLGGFLAYVVLNSEHMHFRPRTFGLIAVLFMGGGFSFINGLFDGDDAQ